ncbi:MAG: hypothetical protein ACP5GI_02545 [Sulfolobales archaeon]
MISTKIDYLSGNIAIAEAALTVGLRFFAGYPITPSSDIFEYLAEKLPERGGYVIQFEDEIASIAAVIGASWTCNKAMTATSGPGFSLMVEGISIAVMTETPLVIGYIMRTGPATGVPTKTGQYDVLQAEYGFHGGLPIPVFSPSSPQEAYDLTIKAFNISEALRTPVVLLSDATLAGTYGKVVMRESTEIEILERRKLSRDNHYMYSSKDLVPPMPCIGEGLKLYVETLTHDERNIYVPTTEVQRRLVSRLYRKIIDNIGMITEYSLYKYGNNRCDLILISYGSSALSASVASKLLNERGYRTCLLKIKSLYPINEILLKNLTEEASKIFVVENNVGLYYREIRGVLKDKDVRNISIIDLHIIDPYEIIEEVLRNL